MTTVSAIVLAAGESQRMGYVNKLELRVQGVPLLCRAMNTLLSCELEEVIVVVGHEAERVRAILDGLPVCVVYNDRYREGRATSVNAGLAVMSKPCDGIMICLSDQGLLEPTDIQGLIDGFAHRSHGSVLVPTYQGRRGNPVICEYRHRQTLLAGRRRVSCRQFIDANPELVYPFEVDRDHVVFDVDTPADYEALLARVSGRNVVAESLAAFCDVTRAAG